jgi:uncharacterized Zn finger protein
MFLSECTHCGRRELRTERAIKALVNTAHGIEVTFDCRGCGAVTTLVTGALRESADPAEATPLIAA